MLSLLSMLSYLCNDPMAHSYYAVLIGSNVTYLMVPYCLQ